MRVGEGEHDDVSLEQLEQHQSSCRCREHGHRRRTTLGKSGAAEDPPADCGQEDSVGQNEELTGRRWYIHGVL